MKSLIFLFGISAPIVLIAFFVLHWRPEYRLTLTIDDDDYFGADQIHRDDNDIVPFRIEIPSRSIDDLKQRLAMTRFSPAIDDRFDYGFNSDQMRSIINEWLTGSQFDWYQHERYLNTHPQFRTEIEGLRIHFIRTIVPTGTYRRVVPLLIVHSWPASIWELYKIMPILSNPARHGFFFGTTDRGLAFQVIAPSLPGVGWSEPSARKGLLFIDNVAFTFVGLNFISIARIYAKLMDRLGYDRYYVHGGGDISMDIVSAMSAMFPKRIKGLHLNTPYVSPFLYPQLFVHHLIASVRPSVFIDAIDLDHFIPIDEHIRQLWQYSGYYHIQSTVPDTIGMALSDSPAGLAAWLIEQTMINTDRRRYLNDSDGALMRHFTLDDLITNVMIYWLTNTTTSSLRLYRDAFDDPLTSTVRRATIDVPTAIAIYPESPFISVKVFLRHKYRNIHRYTMMAKGGRHAALETPKSLAEDLFSFVDQMEDE